MIRLFDERDIEFLRAVPGYTGRMETEFRRRRCRIFRGYLRTLAGRVSGGADRIGNPAHRVSGRSISKLALLVMRCRMRFVWAMIPAYLCLFQYRWELGTAELGPVVQRFESIRGELRRWIPGIA